MSSKALTATPAVLETLSARQLQPYPAIGGTNLNTQRIGAAYVATQNASYGWIYRYSPTVRAVVDYIARNLSQLGLKVYERVSDDEREHAGDHPAAKALRDPNPQTPGQQFVFNLVADYLVYGNAYALKFRTKGGALTLVGLSPHMVGLVGQSYFTVDAYRIWRMDGTSFDVPPEDIIHWRGYNPDDPRKGESYLETLREELAADSASRQATTELHRSGLALPGWIERPIEAPEWSEEGRRRFQESMAEQARQARRRFPVFEEGMVFKTGGVTPEDAELLAGRRWTAEFVSSLYGMKNVPPEGEEERRQFYADVLPPLCEILAAYLDLHVLVQEYGAEDHYFEFNLDEKLMSDDRLKTLTSAAGAPIMLIDEARARLNLPPLPDGLGQKPVIPLNVALGGKPSVDVMPVQDPNKPPQDGSHRSGEADQPAPAGRQSLNGNGHKAVPLVPRRARADKRRDRWAKDYEDVLSSHFSRQRRAMRKEKSKADASKAVATERWDEELAADLSELSRRHFSSEGKQAAFRLASMFDPDQGENWITTKARKAAQGVNQTTQEHIEERGISDAFAYAVGTRAASFGKGYATDIAGFANKAAIQQTPDGDTRTVVIDGGECDICAEFQGAWPVSDLPGWPSYHPGCNCIADISS